MFRSTLIAAGAAVLCSSGFAQNTLDASKVYPITSPVKDAGTFNVNTRRWMSPTQLQAQQQAVGVQVIYDNTCTWTGASFYTGTGSCEDYIDEGTVPGPGNLEFIAAGGDPLLTSTANNVVLFQFGYCTNFAVPALKIGFYNSLGGFCAGGITPTGPSTGSLQMQACPAAQTASGINTASAYYDVGALGLPGDATPGGAGVNCWLFGAFLGNTGFCLQSDGEGIWDNDATSDNFNWSWQMNDAIVSGTAASGIILSGDPTLAPGFGACSYDIPCAADPFTGGPCGTGLGQDDGFWINLDQDPAGTPNTGVACLSAPTAGTGCYWFGGSPGNPWGGFWMVMVADGHCEGQVALVTDCQILPTVSQTCQSTASAVGVPSASGAGTCTLTFGNLNTNVNGVVFYGTNGSNFTPWSAQSNLCVKAPTVRLGGVAGASGNTSGAGPNCIGAYSFNVNTVIVGAGITAGMSMDVQAWFRDSASAKTTQVSDSLRFVVNI